ncbi:MAG: F0F1 ATP synthase subunit epsilon [Phycisphaerales bacterium]|nr:F0F1 ATP synthase subunit epsilon [Phycisphaerales bacterium]
MAKKTFRCRIVTPSASLLDEAVTYASVPAWDGLIGFLPGRAPILAKLGVGELHVRLGDEKGAGGERSYAVDGGVVQMQDDTLTVLAEYAAPAELITPNEAEAELKSVLAKTPSGEGPAKMISQERLNRERQRARVKVRLAKPGNSTV